MGVHKISYRPIQKVENIDEGMKTIINDYQFEHVYVGQRQKSFPVTEIQELHENNLETVETILGLRSKKVREKILLLARERKIYLLFGREFKRVWKSFVFNKKQIIEKQFVCIYIPGLSICPGIYEMTKDFQSLVRNPQNN
ncbi:MAG: hypothetical protein MRY57_01240 [Candidatus Pacebacteria bacterium]|nr:hypothetical protein [Candidatus Paceibacterota bacterium]